MSEQQNPLYNLGLNTGTTSFLHPERIVTRFDLKPGMLVADFGAGAGFFTIPTARLVGEKGKVYAIDIQQSMLDLIKSKADLEHLLNIETVWSNLEEAGGSHLKDGIADFVVIANILFQAENKVMLFEEAHRILKAQGRLSVVEWDEGKFSAGPPSAMRIPKKIAIGLAQQSRFHLDREFEAGSHHYGLMFKK